MDLRARIKEVLTQGYLMSLGTVNSEGVWVSDVIYIHDANLNIYWMSDPDSRHSRALVEKPQVAGTITVNEKRGQEFALQFSGVAERIEGARFDLATKHMLKRGLPTPTEIMDVLEGDSWYVLRPMTIKLIDAVNFGFKRQTLDLAA